MFNTMHILRDKAGWNGQTLPDILEAVLLNEIISKNKGVLSVGFQYKEIVGTH